jgi:hypothetical protein
MSEAMSPLSDRFRIGRALDGALARPLPVTHSLLAQARHRVTMRE